jgi:serine O-acetyltransferase
VKIYQGVTLGALSVKQRHENDKRHPTVEKNVCIYAMHDLEEKLSIGRDSIIGGNAWITSPFRQDHWLPTPQRQK